MVSLCKLFSAYFSKNRPKTETRNQRAVQRNNVTQQELNGISPDGLRRRLHESVGGNLVDTTNNIKSMKGLFISLLLLIGLTSRGQTVTLDNNQKIFGLSKLWSEVNNNFANFDISKTNWDSTYQSYIPQILNTQNDEEYYKLLIKMMASLKDGHSNVYYRPFFEYKTPPIKTKLIDNKVLVTEIFNDTLKRQVQVGDEILKINRISVKEYASRNIAPYISASTKQDLDKRIYSYDLLKGNANEELLLELKRENKIFITSINRLYKSQTKRPKYNLNIRNDSIAILTINSFSVDNYKYIFDSLFTSLIKSKGLIIDIRQNGGGNDNEANYVLSHFISEPVQGYKSKSRQYTPVYKAWGQAETYIEFAPETITPVFSKRPYLKPVVLLISSETYSSAENFVVAFDNCKRGIKIGQTTGGSSGQPLFFELPGNGFARICTKRNLYPDGKEYIGIGIKPDIEITETFETIKANKDLVMEAAINYLKRQK